MTNLARKRKQLGLRQMVMANLLGISQSTYSALERRGIRNVDMAARYARCLGCAPEEILEPARIRAAKQ